MTVLVWMQDAGHAKTAMVTGIAPTMLRSALKANETYQSVLGAELVVELVAELEPELEPDVEPDVEPALVYLEESKPDPTPERWHRKEPQPSKDASVGAC